MLNKQFYVLLIVESTLKLKFTTETVYFVIYRTVFFLFPLYFIIIFTGSFQLKKKLMLSGSCCPIENWILKISLILIFKGVGLELRSDSINSINIQKHHFRKAPVKVVIVYQKLCWYLL